VSDPRLDAARLYFICDCRPSGLALRDVLAPALRGGVDIFQLRDKERPDAAVREAAAVARELCWAAGALFVVNDRPDLAVDADADGVHVGQDDMTVREARAAAPGLIVGRSTHTPEQVGGAGDADYIGVGPVHATPTKHGRPAVGLDLVRHAAGRPGTRPFFAIGGIDEANVAMVAAAGAARIAVVLAIAEAADPEAAARALRAAVEHVPLPHRERTSGPA
jgi:thiamine-phosphate pyrophosphorylase